MKLQIKAGTFQNLQITNSKAFLTVFTFQIQNQISVKGHFGKS